MRPSSVLSQSSPSNKGISLKTLPSPRASTSVKNEPFHSFIQSSEALCTPACIPNTQASGLTCTPERSLTCPVPGCPLSKSGQPAGQGHGRCQRQSSRGLSWPRGEGGEMCCLAPQPVLLGLTSVEVCPGAPIAGPGEPGPAAAAAQLPAGSSPAPCRVPPGPRLGPPSL